MKIKIPDKFSIFLSRKYLDWAECLPRFRGNFIASLQITREHQRKVSEEDFKKSRPPEGTELDFICFRLTEVFHIEEFDKLQNGILNLFPDLESSHSHKDFVDKFNHYSETISGGVGAWKMGRIIKNDKWAFMPDPVRVISNLPEQVEYIEVSLHKTYPSLFFVTLDVYLSEKINSLIDNLQASRYLSNVKYNTFLPWKLRLSGHSENFPNNVRRKTIIEWIDNLRLQIEKCVQPFLKGYFYQNSIKKKPCLPSIEVYGIKGIPNDKEQFENWRNSSRKWWDSLGFQLNFDFFRDDTALFIWANSDSFRGDTPYRCLVLWEQFFKNRSADGYGDERSAIMHISSDWLETISPSIAIIRFLSGARKKIEKLRQVVFRSLRDRQFKLGGLKKLIKLDNTIQNETMVFERISADLDQWQKHTEFDLKSVETLVRYDDPEKEPKSNLKNFILEVIDFEMQRLQSHSNFLSKYLSNHLAIKNVEAMYYLQNRIFWLTIIVTVATIIGLFLHPSFLLKINQVKQILGMIF